MKIKVNKAIVVSTDDRGQIIKLMNQDKFPIRAVLYITMNTGAIRANHYHTKDSHYVYCLSGKFKYYEKGLKKTSKIASVTMKPGDVVLTLPNIIHAMKALEKSVFLAFTTEGRESKKYEKEVVRVKII
jgi:quercetin dioxygenase-like cupin family protein